MAFCHRGSSIASQKKRCILASCLASDNTRQTIDRIMIQQSPMTRLDDNDFQNISELKNPPEGPIISQNLLCHQILPRFSQKHYDINGRCIAIQIGGVLKYFSFLRAQWHPKHCNTNWQIGGILRYKLEVHCNTFLRGNSWGFRHSSDTEARSLPVPPSFAPVHQALGPHTPFAPSPNHFGQF